MVLYRTLLCLSLLLLATSCRFYRSPGDLNPLDDKKEKSPGSDESNGENPSGQSGDPTAVDTGNPTGTGPKPKGSLRLMVADAPLGDGIKKLMIRPVAVQLLKKKREPGKAADLADVVEVALPTVEEHDLLTYRDGKKLTLLDGVSVDAGTYEEVRVILKNDNPLSLQNSDDSFETPLMRSPEEFEGGASTGVFALYGQTAFAVKEQETTELVLHVDVRKQLRLGSELEPPLPGEDADKKWLLPQQELFPPLAVGGLKGLNLKLLFKVACAYPKGATKDPNSSCFHAAASGVLQSGAFYFPYLKPGDYELRIFLNDTVYVDNALSTVVEAGKILEIDLSALELPLP